jgi:hypothetical protein
MTMAWFITAAGHSLGADTVEEALADYCGLWVSPDNRIRHELFPDGRYTEARGSEPEVFAGNYAIYDNRIDYSDDRGFDAYGFFKNDVLYRGGIMLIRQAGA